METDTTEAPAGDGDTDGDGEPETTDAMVDDTDGEDPEPTEPTESTDDVDAGDGDPAPAGGVFTYGDAQEFSNYNNNLGTANSVKNGIILNEVLPSPYNFGNNDGALVLDDELMDSVEITSEEPLTIEYVVNADAAWSDGEPIDCDDFQLQYATPTTATTSNSMTPANRSSTRRAASRVFLFDLVGTTGYADFESLTCSDDLKTMTRHVREPRSPTGSRCSTSRFPAHVIERESGVDDLVAAFESNDR